MPYFQPRLNKALSAAAFVLGLMAHANAAEPSAPDEQELYEYLFPEAGKARALSSSKDMAIQSAPTERVRSAWGNDRPQAWSEDQRQAMQDAFKPKPKPVEPPALLSVPDDSGPFNYSPIAVDGQPYADLIQTYAKKRNLSPLLVQQIIKAESRNDPNAISPKGASGLMQLMPQLAAEFNIDPFDPEMNINVGTQYFAQMLAKYKRVDYALAAYNAGPGAVDKYGGIPPYPETQNYVSSILAGVAQLEAKN